MYNEEDGKFVPLVIENLLSFFNQARFTGKMRLGLVSNSRLLVICIVR